MLLNADYVDPAELTGYVRAALADLEDNQFTLSRWLPSRAIDDLEARFAAGGFGLVESAEVSVYDAEAPIGKRQGSQRVTVELPPIKQKIRLGEYDRLRQRKLDQRIADAILNDAVTMARSVAARVERMRAEALYTGKVVLSENGVVATVDFGRAAGHTTAPGTLWSNTSASTPISDLISWVDIMVAANGVRPEAIVTSRRVVNYLMQNAQIRNLVFPGANQPSLVTVDAVNTILGAYDLPPIYQYNAQVKVSGSATKMIPDDRVLLLPAPGGGDSNELGNTFYGTTAESLESGYGVEGDEPGLVAGAYGTDDPPAIWTKAAAIALPVLANPDLSFAADVA